MAVKATQLYVSVLRPLSGTVPQTVSDVLGFTSGESLFLVTINKVATNSIGFGQTATHQYVYATCSDVFALVSASGINPTETIIQYLGFTVYNIQAVSNTMFTTDASGIVHGSLLYFVQATDPIIQIIGLDNEVARAYHAANSFTFAQSSFPIFPRDVIDIFNFVETVGLSDSEYTREETQSIIKQHLSYSINNGPCVEKSYSPFIGSSDLAGYDEMETTPPVLVSQTLTLQYPYPPLLGGESNPGNTIFVFKNPLFGNSDSLQFTVIDRTTRGGDRIIYGDPKWAKAQLFEYEITNVKKSLMEDFVAFVNLSLGKDIGLTDWFGRQFSGVILAPESPIIETVSGYTIRLKFQGDAASF